MGLFPARVYQVRNSSTLLFSTLITRIFGVKKGKDEHSKKNRSDSPTSHTPAPLQVYPRVAGSRTQAFSGIGRHEAASTRRFQAFAQVQRPDRWGALL